jgi:hypothetical protein
MYKRFVAVDETWDPDDELFIEYLLHRHSF